MLAREENILDLFVEIPVERLVGTLKESSIASKFFFLGEFSPADDFIFILFYFFKTDKNPCLNY
jgi:hypothetical protein